MSYFINYVTICWKPLLLGWRPRPSLLGWRHRYTRVEAISIRLEAMALGLSFRMLLTFGRQTIPHLPLFPFGHTAINALHWVETLQTGPTCATPFSPHESEQIRSAFCCLVASLLVVMPGAPSSDARSPW